MALCGVALAWLPPVACSRNDAREKSAAALRDGNLLLITLDTTRADSLSCYAPTPSTAPKQHGAKTPQLDALAARGVLFRNATAHAPLTLPSHASILTGVYPTLHGLRDMEGFVLSPTRATLATVARAAGFATAAFVGSRVLAKEFGLGGGFAVYDDDIGGGFDEETVTGHSAERRADGVTSRAIEWLEQNQRKRFFLWVHYFDPHLPYDPPEPYKSAYARDPYAGEIAYMDEQVGRLLEKLRVNQLESQTLVAAIGDHGESLGEHGELTHGVFLYDSTLRVPFLLAGPGLPSGKVIETQVRAIDVMPTALAFLNLPSPPGVQGANLLPLLARGEDVGSGYSYSETLYPRTFLGWSELRAMRTEKRKLVLAPRRELYDLQADPGETANEMEKSPAEADALAGRLWQVAGEQNRTESLTTNPVGAQTRRELESLGYTGGGTTGRIQLGTPAPDPKDRVAVLKILGSVEDLLSRKQWAQAAKLMEQGLRLDPVNPRSHLYLATAYEQQGQYARAVAVLQAAIRAKIETDRVYARLGIDYLHLGEAVKAIGAMDRARQLNPKDLHNLRNLGMAHLQMGQVEDAERAFRAITVQNDRYSAAHNGLGLVAVQRRDAETARREFEKAVEVNPNEVKSLLDLGILYQQLGSREESIRYLESFLRKAPQGQFAGQIAEVRAAIQEMRGGR